MRPRFRRRNDPAPARKFRHRHAAPPGERMRRRRDDLHAAMSERPDLELLDRLPVRHRLVHPADHAVEFPCAQRRHQVARPPLADPDAARAPRPLETRERRRQQLHTHDLDAPDAQHRLARRRARRFHRALDRNQRDGEPLERERACRRQPSAARTALDQPRLEHGFELAQQQRARGLADAELARRASQRAVAVDQLQQAEMAQAQAVGAIDRRGYAARGFEWAHRGS